MGFNLRISIEEFRKNWEESYLSHKGKCKHHDNRFNEGWIPLSAEPFSPALGRFSGSTELAREIVKELEEKGRCVFKEKSYMTVNDVEPALREIMFHIPKDIECLIADYGTVPLMLDRKAFTIDGYLIGCYIQWYVSRKVN